MLKHFETVERVFTAPVSELTKVKGVGLKTVEKIREILTKKFKLKSLN